MTLLETMVVVAIIGVITLLSVPGVLLMIRRARVAGVTREVSSLITSTRANAITRGFPAAVCFRGRAFGDPTDGFPLTAVSWRKGVMTPRQLCTTPGVCPPAVMDPTNAVYTPGAAPPDVRGLDYTVGNANQGQTTQGVSWTTPTGDNQVFTLVFDAEGIPSAFSADRCTDPAAPTAVAPSVNGYTFTIINDNDNTITETVVVRVDGTVITP